jgi:dephospho-CoA kinase
MTAGLTGGIGSGKSVVSNLFEMYGCLIFNSDERAKQAYFIPEIKKKVIALLGEEVYFKNGQLNKTFVGDKIFNDASLLRSINAIIHPEVISQFIELKKQNPDKIIIKETALLFEAGLEKYCDASITVVAPDEMRIIRVMERDGLTKDQVEKKIKNQLSQEEKIKKSTFVIHNNEEDSLIQQSLKIFEELKKRKA